MSDTTRYTDHRRDEASAVVPTMFARRVSWGAIFAGTVVAMVLQIVLTLLGLGIGLYAIDPGAGDGGTAWGTWAWWLISGVISLAAGAWVAARLAGIPRRTEGALHGLATWGVTTLATLFLFGTAAGSVLSGGWGIMQSSMEGQGQPEIAAVIPDMQTQPGQQGQTQPQVQPQAQPAAPSEEQVNTVAAAALWTFGMLVLGAIATAVGGAMGSPHHLPVAGVDMSEHDRYERNK